MYAVGGHRLRKLKFTTQNTSNTKISRFTAVGLYTVTEPHILMQPFLEYYAQCHSKEPRC